MTTITTVGFGDITATNTTEAICCILIMIVGVLAFSFASGSLSSILGSYDQTEAIMKEKISTLNEISTKYSLNNSLYDEIRKIIRFDHSKRVDQYSKFKSELPPHLQIKLSMEIHRNIYQKIDFFKHKPKEFIAWCVPMLISVHFHCEQNIYSEGDSINNMYFIEKGSSAFVLPRYQNAAYIVVERGDYFGVIDLVPMREKDGKYKKVEGNHLKRIFTVQAEGETDLLALKITDMEKIRFEFPLIFK